jgi:hypothetical protein
LRVADFNRLQCGALGFTALCRGRSCRSSSALCGNVHSFRQRYARLINNRERVGIVDYVGVDNFILHWLGAEPGESRDRTVTWRLTKQSTTPSNYREIATPANCIASATYALSRNIPSEGSIPLSKPSKPHPYGSDCLQIYYEADWLELLAKLKQSSSNPQAGLLVDNCAESTSIASCDRAGNVCRCVGCDHHLTALICLPSSISSRLGGAKIKASKLSSLSVMTADSCCHLSKANNSIEVS